MFWKEPYPEPVQAPETELLVVKGNHEQHDNRYDRGKLFSQPNAVAVGGGRPEAMMRNTQIPYRDDDGGGSRMFTGSDVFSRQQEQPQQFSNFVSSNANSSFGGSPKYNLFGGSSPIPRSSIVHSTITGSSSANSLVFDPEELNLGDLSVAEFALGENTANAVQDSSWYRVSVQRCALDSVQDDVLFSVEVLVGTRSFQAQRGYNHFKRLHQDVLDKFPSSMTSQLNFPSPPNQKRDAWHESLRIQLEDYLSTLLGYQQMWESITLARFLDQTYHALSLSYEVCQLKSQLRELETMRAEHVILQARIKNQQQQIRQLHQRLKHDWSRIRTHSDFLSLEQRELETNEHEHENDNENEGKDASSISMDFIGHGDTDLDESGSEELNSLSEATGLPPPPGLTHRTFQPMLNPAMNNVFIPSNRLNDDVASPIGLLDSEMERLAGCVTPSPAAQRHRETIVAIVHRILKQSLGAQSYQVGPGGLRTYLPDDKLSVSVFVSDNIEVRWFAKVSEVLCTMASMDPAQAAQYGFIGGEDDISSISPIQEEEEGGESAENDKATTFAGVAARGLNMNPSNSTIPSGKSINTKQLPATRVRVGKVSFQPTSRSIVCTINGITVEIMANRLDELCFIAFIEEIDRIIGKDHLFKRTVLLLKAWCFYENRNATTSRHALSKVLNDKLLCTLVLHVFNVNYTRIHTLTQALAYFFQTFETVNFANTIVTPFAIIPNTFAAPMQAISDQEHNGLIPNDLYERYVERYSRSLAKLPNFPSKSMNLFMNVQDPLARDVNLTSYMTKEDVDFARDRLAVASQAFAHILEILRKEQSIYNENIKVSNGYVLGAEHKATYISSDARDLLQKCFARTLNRFASGNRPDTPVKTSSRQHSLSASSGFAVGDSMRKVASFPANIGANDSILSLESLTDYNRNYNTKIALPQQDALVVDLPQLTATLQYCSLLLDSEVTTPALLSLSREILLEKKGGLPVGEIGKMLQEATSNTQIPAILKEMFGGLKKFLEVHQSTFLISNDHPYNPKVYLREALSESEVQAVLSGNVPPSLQSLGPASACTSSSSSRKRKSGRRKAASPSVHTSNA